MLLGGKGTALVRMTEMELPVPPGFILTTEACNRVREGGWFAELDEAIGGGVAELELTTGRTLGSGSVPLLVSVRSGAPVSMPGMMDTALNVAMTGDAAIALGVATGDEWFAWDTARRFVQSYSVIVLGVPGDLMRTISTDCLGHDEGRGMNPDELAAAAGRMRSLLRDRGFEIPSAPLDQVRAAVGAVFASWHSDRAQAYRRVEGISESLGTAATVQMMTFGNLGPRSGTGVAFTRDPSSGAKGLVGDFLVGAQGEDVVAGTHSTLPVSELRTRWPDVADELDKAAARLELDLGDLVDIEFTVENGTLWLLQVRRGKRSPIAALRVAIDIAEDPAFSLRRRDAVELVADILEHPPTRSNPETAGDLQGAVLATGLAASPGRVVGPLCTDIDDAIAAGAKGEPVILVRRETSPADIAGMAEAGGLVTSLGGLVSHAAVIARSWGVPAVVGASAVTVEVDGISIAGRHIAAGEILTVDGDRGVVLLGDHRGEEIEVEEVAILRRWQREVEGAAGSVASSPSTCAEAATVETCERVLGLKGAASAATVAEVLGCAVGDVAVIVARLITTESAQQLPGERVRLLPDAIARVGSRFAADAERLGPIVEPLWNDFHDVNDELKEVVAAWQVREIGGESVPNDHTDADYDAWVVARLRIDVHATILPIIDVVAASEPRFERYRERLDGSLASVSAGDLQMIAHPLRDSYHTVWFELHEELIRLTGRNRADEAAAGRA
jgi:pyruvate,orthophosphate dikinase